MTVSQDEQIRLNEIIFCKLFQQLLKQHVNPIKVYDLISAVATVTDANILILNNVMTIILNNDRQYMHTKQEYAYLLKQSAVSVRRTCKLAGISPNTYYAISADNIHTTPRFTPIQYAEMMKILKFFNNAYQNMEGSSL